MQLINTVRTFLHEVGYDEKRPLLLGYSGGPDSKALLYALLDAGIKQLHIAHVDHGWREESGEERDAIEKEAAALSLPCHIHKLTEKCSGNWEETGRLARILFYTRLFETVPFQAILLGHHANDLAETALKQLLEGAHLCNLRGMEKKSVLYGIPFWRPFLDTPKSDLLEFVQNRSLPYFVDRTNLDPKFLRTRLREEMIPQLEASFGKNIFGNLVLLSERSQELKIFLDRLIEPIWERRLEVPQGWALELKSVERILSRHLLQSKLPRKLPRGVLESALDALQKGSKFLVSEQIWVEKGSLFFRSK